ncbi:MAG: FosX/FosE/FosI family fosfomycin resistance hydrolase [Rhabdaerophilum sp.]
MISGLSHITFIVRDLDRMTRFLTGIFDAKEVYSSGDASFSRSREKFFLISDIWVAIMEGEAIPRSYNHVAFKIDDNAVDGYVARIRAMGVEMLPPRPRVEGEGHSIYFYDFDNHLFELHTGTLSERLARYAMGKQVSS